MISVGDGTDDSAMNKYRGRTGESHRGRCVAIRNDGKQALIEGLTEHPGRILLVQERAPGHWPWFVRFWEEDLPMEGWHRYGYLWAPSSRRTWLDKIVSYVRRWKR